MAKTLTVRQEKFIQKYLECSNASEAYRCAYDAAKMKPEVVHVKASNVLSNGKVTVRLTELQQRVDKRAELSLTEVANMLSDVVMVDVTDFVDPNGMVKVDAIRKMPIEKRRLIKSIEAKRSGVKIELMDKHAAIDRLSNLRGWNAPVKSDVNMTANFDLQKIKENTTPEQLVALAALGKTSLPL